jgi:secreted Zn-dependent insulinase-like peptidase
LTATKDVFISESGLKNELVQELFDFIETEYFASALYELIQASFEKMETTLIEELMKKP